MRRILFTLVLVSLVVIVAYTPSTARAQFTIPGAESALTFSMTPSHPGPNTSVSITLQSPLYDLAQSDITWTVNGKIFASDIGLRNIKVTTGDSGSSLFIVANVSAQNGIASQSIRISPASVDLLWESDSYVPPFYKGRALPSAGSSVVVVAVPHFVRSDGKIVASNDITYLWKKDGEELTALSGRGKASVRIAGPLLYGSDTISVEAISNVDGLSGSASIRIVDVEPTLSLYEVHPLFGVLYNNALGATTFIPDVEMSFLVVPYFAAVHSPADVGLQYEWRVNDQSVLADTTQPNSLTINAEKSSGIALIRLALTHATNFYMSLDNAWRVTFTKNGGTTSAGIDPFRQ